MARDTLIQMKGAVQIGFDCYVNLNDGMMPIKTRGETAAFLEEQNDKGFCYAETSEKEEPALREKTLKYYPSTNLLAFLKGKATRAIIRGFGNLLYASHIRRTLDGVIQIGSPWFMLTHVSIQTLVGSFDYCSTTFELSQYAEEMHIPTMLDKFRNRYVEHVNNDYRVVRDGKWKRNQDTCTATQEAVDQYPEVLFAGVILVDEDFTLYEKYFDIYNANLETEE